MSKDDIYNALCAVFFNEEVRLLNRVHDLEYFIWQRGADSNSIIELIEARARLEYFRTYMMDVLRFLKYYDR